MNSTWRSSFLYGVRGETELTRGPVGPRGPWGPLTPMAPCGEPINVSGFALTERRLPLLLLHLSKASPDILHSPVAPIFPFLPAVPLVPVVPAQSHVSGVQYSDILHLVVLIDVQHE